MKHNSSITGTLTEMIVNLLVLAIFAAIGLAIGNFDKIVAVAAPGWAAEQCLEERWEEMAKTHPVMARTKFVSAEIFG